MNKKKESKVVPNVRFKGFTDDWKQRKLGELAFFNPKEEIPDVFEYVDLESVVGIEMLSHRTEEKATAPSRAQRLAHTGDLFYQTVRPYQKNNYLFEKSEKHYVFSTGYAQLRPLVDGYFLLSLVQNGQFVKTVLDNCTGTSYPAINANDLAEIEVFYSKDEHEHHQIGEYFRHLDNLITLHQQKLTLLTKLKKAMLEKMFPKKGSVIPEIRFNGFANAWEQQKLGEVFETVTDYVAAGSFADLAENVVYRDTPNYAQLVRTTDLKNGFHSGSNVYVDKKAFDFLYRVNLDKECIILPNIGNCGEVYLVIPDDLPYKHNVLGPNAILIRSDTSDNVFLSILLQGKDFQEKLSLIISPNGQTKFNKTELKQISLNMPKQSDEQHQLGAYFSQLDRLITLHRSKIDKIKNMKKAMLDQMFIQ